MAKVMTEIMLIDSNKDNDAQVPIFLIKGAISSSQTVLNEWTLGLLKSWRAQWFSSVSNTHCKISCHVLATIENPITDGEFCLFENMRSHMQIPVMRTRFLPE